MNLISKECKQEITETLGRLQTLADDVCDLLYTSSGDKFKNFNIEWVRLKCTETQLCINGNGLSIWRVFIRGVSPRSKAFHDEIYDQLRKKADLQCIQDDLLMVECDW